MTRRSRDNVLAAAGGLAAVAAVAGAWTVREEAWAAIESHPYFALEEIRVDGAVRFLDERTVRDWLGVEIGASLWKISPSQARARLAEHPFVEAASVRRVFPHRLEIRIREREPQAVVVLDDLYYLDRGGTLFGPLAGEHALDYPVITGLDADAPAGERAWVLRRAARLARLCRRRGCFGGLSEIHLDDRFDVVLHPRRPPISVILGWGSWREKLRRARRVLEDWAGQTAQLAAVDVRFRNQVVVRLRSATDPAPAAEPPARRDSAPAGRGMVHV